ncbi:hypothetical protein BHM03_00054300, partial [Ensete ventricosum]
ALALLHPHCIIATAAPTQVAAALCGRQSPFQGATTPAAGAAAPAGGRVGRSRSCPRVAAPCRGACRNRPPLAGNQAMVGRTYRGPGCGQPPLHANSMHVATPPPQAAPTFAANRCNKCVEQFYVIQSRHTQFKTNFSHKNLGSNITLGNLSGCITYAAKIKTKISFSRRSNRRAKD